MALVQTLPTEEMTERRLLTCKEEFAKLINTNQPLAKFLIGISKFQRTAHYTFFSSPVGVLDLNVVMGKLYHECSEAKNELKVNGRDDLLFIELTDILIYTLMFVSHVIDMYSEDYVENSSGIKPATRDELFEQFEQKISDSLLRYADPAKIQRYKSNLTMDESEPNGVPAIESRLDFVTNSFVYKMFCAINFSYHRPDKKSDIESCMESAVEAITMIITMQEQMLFSKLGTQRKEINKVYGVELPETIEPDNICSVLKDMYFYKISRFLSFVDKTFANRFSI